MLDAHNCNLHTLYEAMTKKKPRMISDKAKLKALVRNVKPVQRKSLIDKLLELEQAGALTEENYRKALSNKLGISPIDENLAKQITGKAEELRKLPDGREKTVKSAELMALLQKGAPIGIGKKLSAAQTLGQLLNVKTITRNVLGNGLFSAVDTSSNALASVLDRAIALKTGKRTRVMPQVNGAKDSLVTGAKMGYEDSIKGIDTSGSAGKFDLPQGHTFKNPILNNLEKTMGVALKAPDRAFYELARNESIQNQLKASGRKEITPEMIATAHEEALYKTFQDESHAAKLMTGIKKALNFGKDFGMGDFVLKYPKTPGNLLSRAFAYSPAGFLRSVHIMAEPLFKAKEFNQRAFVDSFARATVGTVGVGSLGYTLGKLGIASGDPASDKDIRSISKLKGVQPHSINISALMRFGVTYTPESAKPQVGDKWISYDWAQPMAIPFSASVNIGANRERGGKKGSAADVAKYGGEIGKATIEATDTLTNQGVMQGVEKLTSRRGPDGNISIPEGVMATAADAPASFVPTAVNQVNQAIDNTQRDTRDKNILLESANNVKAKIPGLAQTLPARKNVYGQTAERYQDGSNNPFNVFVNPAFVSTLKADPTGDEVLRLYNQQGETQQAPRNAPYKISIRQHGETFHKTLTPQEHSQYQEYVGKKTKTLFDQLTSIPIYNRLNDESKAKAMASVMTDINDAAKIDLFDHQLSKRQSFFIRAVRRDNMPLAMQAMKVKLQKAYIAQLKEGVRNR